jgi:hypothetical protein
MQGHTPTGLTSKKLLKNSLFRWLLLSLFGFAFVATRTRTASGPDISLVYPSYGKKKELANILSFSYTVKSVKLYNSLATWGNSLTILNTPCGPN